MKLAIMQPYFLPYIGYFQLINAVDEFVVYDNIQFTKKGWINRNRILVNGKDDFISLPLKKDSDYLDIKDRFLADSWIIERKKMLNKIKETYKKAAYFDSVYPVMEKIIMYNESNLFKFVLNSLNLVIEYIGLNTPLIISSTISIDHTLKSEKKVIEICKAKNATNYINPIGGAGLYDKEHFSKEGIKLEFIKANDIIYTQFDKKFLPFLSIIDVMMFNSKEEIKNLLSSFILE